MKVAHAVIGMKMSFRAGSRNLRPLEQRLIVPSPRTCPGRRYNSGHEGAARRRVSAVRLRPLGGACPEPVEGLGVTVQAGDDIRGWRDILTGIKE